MVREGKIDPVPVGDRDVPGAEKSPGNLWRPPGRAEILTWESRAAKAANRAGGGGGPLSSKLGEAVSRAAQPAQDVLIDTPSCQDVAGLLDQGGEGPKGGDVGVLFPTKTCWGA